MELPNEDIHAEAMIYKCFLGTYRGVNMLLEILAMGCLFVSWDKINHLCNMMLLVK